MAAQSAQPYIQRNHAGGLKPNHVGGLQPNNHAGGLRPNNADGLVGQQTVAPHHGRWPMESDTAPLPGDYIIETVFNIAQFAAPYFCANVVRYIRFVFANM